MFQEGEGEGGYADLSWCAWGVGWAVGLRMGLLGSDALDACAGVVGDGWEAFV